MISVVGAGAWGTALAIIAQRRDNDVLLWAFEEDVAHSIKTKHSNPMFLPGQTLSKKIRSTSNIMDIAQSDIILLATPAQYLRRTIEPLSGQINSSTPLIICSKGIEQKTCALMTEIVSKIFKENPLLVLSGPTFAIEVASGLPTAVTLAGEDRNISKTVTNRIGSKWFRPYASNDLIGAQIGGAIKNVLAIACGISQGLNLGYNARAAIITRGLAELKRLSIAKGGQAETVSGLSGLGDLLLTCTSTQSRNYSLGVALGQGKKLIQIQATRHSIAEGVFTSSAAVALAKQLEIEMPIVSAVYSILYEKADINEQIGSLLDRPFRSEFF